VQEETDEQRFITVKHFNIFNIPSTVTVEAEDDNEIFLYKTYAFFYTRSHSFQTFSGREIGRH